MRLISYGASWCADATPGCSPVRLQFTHIGSIPLGAEVEEVKYFGRGVKLAHDEQHFLVNKTPVLL